MLHVLAQERSRRRTDSRSCFLFPLLNRDEETTTAPKKLIADCAGVPYGPRAGILREKGTGGFFVYL